MEIFDPEAPVVIPEMRLEFHKHAQDCPAGPAERCQPGHPVLAKLCNCGAIKKPEPIKLNVLVRVKGSDDIMLKTGSMTGMLTLWLGHDGYTNLTPAAADAVGVRLIQWANSVRESGA